MNTITVVYSTRKIEQNYLKGQTVHVLDASRSVTVVESLLGPKKDLFVSDLKSEYERVRGHHEKSRGRKQLLSLKEARNNKFVIDWKQ